jgi:hypothetical protein
MITHVRRYHVSARKSSCRRCRPVRATCGGRPREVCAPGTLDRGCNCLGLTPDRLLRERRDRWKGDRPFAQLLFHALASDVDRWRPGRIDHVGHGRPPGWFDSDRAVPRF